MTATDPPALTGPVGVAWEYPVGNAAPHSVLSFWLIESPGSHPFWSRWLLSTIHLRDVPGLPPAKIHVPNATHESALYALDPQDYASQFPIGDAPPRMTLLQPVNWACQYFASEDARAVAFARALALGLVQGMALLEPQGVQGADLLHRSFFQSALDMADPPLQGFDRPLDLLR